MMFKGNDELIISESDEIKVNIYEFPKKSLCTTIENGKEKLDITMSTKTFEKIVKLYQENVK